jgi:hypothetical protein
MAPVFSFFTRTPRTANFARPNHSYEFVNSDADTILAKDGQKTTDTLAQKMAGKHNGRRSIAA